jgi:hypothetical protein
VPGDGHFILLHAITASDGQPSSVVATIVATPGTLGPSYSGTAAAASGCKRDASSWRTLHRR